MSSRAGMTVLRTIAIAVAGLFAAILIGVSLPARFKLIGLFSIAFAGVIGWGFGRLVATAGLSRKSRLVPLAALVVSVGLAGYHAESYRRWKEARIAYHSERLRQQPGGAQILERVLSGTVPDDPTLRMIDAPYRRIFQARFSEYLFERASTGWFLGREYRLREPWPAVWIGVEATAALLTGIWLATIGAAQSVSVTAKDSP